VISQAAAGGEVGCGAIVAGTRVEVEIKVGLGVDVRVGG